MAHLTWDNTGDHFYETGVRRGVLYLLDEDTGDYPYGVAWNGLTTITESPSGAEATGIYADDIKYLNLYSAEEFGATIEAYTYPDQFAECDGTSTLTTGIQIGQQSRKTFGLCYRTAVGNDILGDEYSYKLHILYGCKASPSEKSYQTINDSPEAITFSWEVTTTPQAIGSRYNPTACVVIDPRKVNPMVDNKYYALLGYLYGADNEAFSSSKLYSVGDTCTNDGKYYFCKRATVAGETSEMMQFAQIAAMSEWDGNPRLPLPQEIMTMLDVVST